MRLNKCDAYTAKEILGCRGRKLYVAVARRAAKREGKQIAKAPQRGGERNPWNSRTEKLRKGQKHPETRNRSGSMERERRRGSNQQDENTRRDCHQTETCRGKRQRKITKDRNKKLLVY